MASDPSISRASYGAIRLALIGCSHRTASLELRERVAFSPEQAVRAAEELRSAGIVEEAVVLSTCNRSELYGVTPDVQRSASLAMEKFLAEFHRVSSSDLDGSVYHQRDLEAVKHLFRVTAGLDSMLLGEAEILGQVREAYGRALESGTTGPVLNRLFQAALEVGKRVRAETEVGARPMSVALAGIKLAEQVFGNLAGREALIVGAGGVAEQVVEHLQSRRIGWLRIVNRSRERAADLAGRAGGEAVEWSALENSLASPDIIVASVSGSETLITRAMLEAAVAERAGRPVFIVDLGVPRNIEPAARRIYNLYLYNVDDLGEIVEQNRKAREAEIPRAEAIIAEHLAKFEAWKSGVEGLSLVEELRQRLDSERRKILGEWHGSLAHLSEADWRAVEKLTEDLMQRLLAPGAERLRRTPELRKRLAALDGLREFFRLDGGKS